ncbi:MAG: hypothetical protein H7A53_12440 [Akkermansiaceae bacterium]|nr:hypothetical protein [Akkermansiaceae bacterium]
MALALREYARTIPRAMGFAWDRQARLRSMAKIQRIGLNFGARRETG